MHHSESKGASIIPAVSIILVALLIGGGLFWYSLNKEIVFPETNLAMTGGAPIAGTLAYQQGDVFVLFASGSEWEQAETDTVLHAGDSVRTGDASTNPKAIIDLEMGDTIRLGYGTELSFSALKQDKVTVSQVTGAIYSRVAKRSRGLYEVQVGDVRIRALGTAFDVVIDGKEVGVNVVESTVAVVTDAGQQRVEEGSSATIDSDTKDLSVTLMDQSALDNEWYTWNKEEDSKTNRDLGILEQFAGPDVDVTSPADGSTVKTATVTVSGTVSDFEATVTVGGAAVVNSAGQFTHEVELVSGKNVISVTAQNAEGYRTVKEIKVTYAEDIPATATPIEVSAETGADGVSLSWNQSSGTVFQYYKVVRSESNPEPTYPDDGYIAVLNKGDERYTDTEVSADKTYYYRICEVMAEGEVFCSNVVHMKGKQQQEQNENQNQGETQNQEQEHNQEQATEAGLSLSATAESDGVHLSWTTGGLDVSGGFKLVRGTAANPVYPGNDYQYLSDSSARSYTWALTDGKTYHFRVCQYNGEGTCLSYSNNVELTAYEQPTPEISLIMSATPEDTGVGLWWSDVSAMSGFKYYKVVRSETNADLRYPDDSYIAVKSAGEESHRDYSAVKGTPYFYRICAVGDAIVCSNVLQITPIHTNAAPTAGTLSGSFSGGQLTLSWTASGEADFKYYKVVWSQADSTPVYPTDGYIGVISDANTVTFTDDGEPAGSRKDSVCLNCTTNYYAVCVVDSQSQVACSNAVTLSGGAVQ
ncbi:MAG: FecR domain-containing protein [Patescibacteria group bacterium]